MTSPAESAWGEALRLVADAFLRHGITAQAAGGLAARAWGGSRPLADLDFYVPDDQVARAATALQPWVVRGPERLRAERWDILVLVLDVHGCRVELGGADTGRYRDTRGIWRNAAVDFAAGVRRAVFSVPVDVMPREALITYKTALGRDVDLVDLFDLTGQPGATRERLAVYGTLAPGEANHHVVADLRGPWTRGVVHGTLRRSGWGAAHGFPALRWHPDAPPVEVRVLTSPDLPAAWPRLDAFEGPGYRRIVVPVHSDTGRQLAHLFADAGGA